MKKSLRLPTIVALAFLLVSITFPGLSLGLATPGVIVARTGRLAIVIWDTRAFFQQHQSGNLTQTLAERRVVQEAFRILAQQAAGLKRSNDIRLLVMVSKPANGDNFIYHNTPFSETTDLFTMEASRASIIKNSAAWTKKLKNGKMPRGLSVHWEKHLSP